MSTFRDQSRAHWESNSSVEHINAGSLQRIADATELMAKSHTDLLRDKDNYKRWYEGERASRQKLELRVAALKGVITKLKKEPKISGFVTHED